MKFSVDNINELNILMLFDVASGQEGIKIHKTAAAEAIAAAQSLFNKGFITQVDGGYLTDLGHEAAEYTQSLYTMLNAGSE